MRRLASILALVLGLTLLAAPPASVAVAAHAENRASGSAAGLTTLIEIEARLSEEAIRENAGLAYDIASDDAVAARGGTTVIGKLDDLKNLRTGEQTMLGRLPNRGSPQANWHQNSGVLRQEMGRGLPIRDASVDSTGNLINNTGFLRAERNLLQSRGWTYNPSTTMWHPPVGP